jgi:cysteine-rich repeat protein
MQHSTIPSRLLLALVVLFLAATPRAALAHEGEHVCGDGVVEAEEQCDDANQIDDDDCHNDCTLNCSAEDYPSTFAAIQDIVFEGYDCTNGICHSTAAASISGGLNLEAAHSYVGLLGASGTGAASGGNLLKRVEPSEPELSFLYLKLLKKTDPAQLAEIHPADDVGTPMPSNLLTLTPQHLEAVRLWIRGGAPADKVVEGTAPLLGTCLPEPDPLKIPLPPAPPAGEGVQFRQPPWPLPANAGDSQGEDEICMSAYYDFSATTLVPDWAKLGCPPELQLRKGCSQNSDQTCDEDADCGEGNTCEPVRNALNPESECFTWDRQVLYQDPQSHHSIINLYTGAADTSDPSWGPWTYKLEPDDPEYAAKHGQPCNPLEVDPALGYNRGCASSVVSSFACIGYGPPDASGFDSNVLPMIGGSQEPYYVVDLAAGAYGRLPMKGLVVWNSHAFNLTPTDSTLAQYLNVEFAPPEDQQYPTEQLFIADWIFATNVPPFQSQEVCSTWTLPQNTNLFRLSSHTHRHGALWRTWAPPNTPCQPACPETACIPGSGGICFGCENVSGTVCSDDYFTQCSSDAECGEGNACVPLPICDGPREDAPIYFSTSYSDPLQLDFTPPVYLGSPDVEDRTYLFCAVYDNGIEVPVKQHSTSPLPPPLKIFGVELDPSTTEFIGGPCSPAKLACLDGPNQGELCWTGEITSSDAFCGGPGLCDACPVHGGITTEDEMFILLGNYYVPEPASGLLGAVALGAAGLLARRVRRA